MRESSAASASIETQEREPYAGRVERELQGYLAAVEEGLPVLEPRSSLVAAVVIGQVAQWLLAKVADSEMARWVRRAPGLPSGRSLAWRSLRSEDAHGDLPTRARRLRFARFLFLNGRISG